MPGISVLPPRSTTRSASRWRSATSGPTATIRSPSTSSADDRGREALNLGTQVGRRERVPRVSERIGHQLLHLSPAPERQDDLAGVPLRELRIERLRVDDADPPAERVERRLAQATILD